MVGSHPRQGAASVDSGSSDIFSTVECPTCGRDDFKSNRGMRRHHAMAHGESLSYVEHTCENCGDEFTIPHAWDKKENNGRFCSEECREEVVNAKQREKRKCDACGDTYTCLKTSAQRFCSYECAIGNRKIDGRHTKECLICGEEFNTGGPSKADRRVTCSKECGGIYKSQTYTGENSPTWKGGMPDYYGERWNEQRRKALERDGYECVICGRGKHNLGIRPDVHHIVPVTSYDDPNDAHDLLNLVTLCRKHHSNWEGLYLRPDTRGKDND